MKGKHFSELLKELLGDANMKNAQLAGCLGYDISYISKWTSGKLLPAAKNIHRIIALTAGAVAENIPDSDIENILLKYGSRDRTTLESTVRNMLEEAYLQDIRNRSDDSDFGVRIDYFSGLSTQKDVLEQLNEVFADSKKIFAMVDLTCMERESLLSFLGICDGSLVPEKSIGTGETDLVLILNIGRMQDERKMYLFITLMHLICVFSHKNTFDLVLQEWAEGKFIAIDPDNGKLLSTSLMKNSGTCLSFLVREDKTDTLRIQREISAMIRREKAALQLYLPEEIYEKNDYLKVIISPNQRWLVGHITELFISAEQLGDFRARMGTDDYGFDRIRTVHRLIKNILKKNDIRILLYETAISDFILDGEADIFDKHIRMTISERIDVLENIIRLLDYDNIRIKLISGGFYDDYKHAPNPCVFSSPVGSFMRVENSLQRNNVYSVTSGRLRNLVNECFEELWMEPGELLYDDRDYIRKSLRSYAENCRMLQV